MILYRFMFHTWRTFQLACVARLFAQFYVGTRKWLQDFLPCLLEQPVKFLLNCIVLSQILTHFLDKSESCCNSEPDIVKSLSLAPTCSKNYENFRFLRSSDPRILTTIVNIASQTSQTVSDFYVSLEEWESFLLKVHLRRLPTIGNFSGNYEREICMTGKDADEAIFYDKCKDAICLSGTSGMLDY